ncbi:AI-2E family transporter [Candidatus Saccharibacteria bacterium]|nr:AI-2E family transporter [Candidatus Saccharibacteria bacterium]NCS83204.1 AI-2E family transporter [Candidatus Saccharibacteria bacterium]
MSQRIEIDTRTFVRFWLVIVGLAAVVALIYQARTGLLILGVSLFLALALNAPVTYIAKRLPSRSRVGATALSYLGVIAFIGVIVFLVIPPVVQQTARFAQNIPATVESLTDQWRGLGSFVDEYNLQPQLDTALDSIKASSASLAGNLGEGLVTSIGSFFAFIAALVLVLVLTFLMLIEGPTWLSRLWRLYTNKRMMNLHRRIVTRMYKTVSGFVLGQLTVSSIGAIAAGLAVFILSIVFDTIPANLAIPTAAVTFILSLIPMFGATIGGVLITALLAFNAIPAAIIYAVYFVVYQQIENNLIAPHIQAKRIELSPLAVLGAVTVGLYMFGVVGGIVAIPIAGSLRVLFLEYIEDRRS